MANKAHDVCAGLEDLSFLEMLIEIYIINAGTVLGCTLSFIVVLCFLRQLEFIILWLNRVICFLVKYSLHCHNRSSRFLFQVLFLASY